MPPPTCTQLLTLPTWGKVVTVFAITAPIVVAGSLALHALTGDSLGAAAQRVYYILNNVPGGSVGGWLSLPVGGSVSNRFSRSATNHCYLYLPPQAATLPASPTPLHCCCLMPCTWWGCCRSRCSSDCWGTTFGGQWRRHACECTGGGWLSTTGKTEALSPAVIALVPGSIWGAMEAARL